MDELLVEFLAESREGLDKLCIDFIALERNPDDADTVASVFRTVHTIKGTCGFLGFDNLERLAHAGESLLAELRDGTLRLDEAIVSALLELADAIRAILNQVEAGGQDGGDYTALIEQLHALKRSGGVGAAIMIAANPKADLSVPNAPPPADATAAGQAAPFDEEMTEVIGEFLGESVEGLERVSGELVSLEDNPEDKSVIGSIFRTMHTIKGTCGFLGFDKLEKLTHAAENLLVKLRDTDLSMSQSVADALLATVDACRAMISSVASVGHDGADPYPGLIQTLQDLAYDKHGTQGAGEPTTAIEEHSETASSQAAPDLAPAAAVTPASGQPASTGARSGMPARATGTVPAKSPSPAVETSIRVDVPLLDSLMNLVGELVLARNQIVEQVSLYEDPSLMASAQRLNLITSELQEGVMQTRMQPIHRVWAKLPRVVRDLARGCGKKVRVEMEGKETELDKSLIEAMKDPMTHLVRNCVDHGIEAPEVREANGKPAEGVLRLRAYHEGGYVHIEVHDDGAGINPGKLRAKTLENGLMTPAQIEGLSDAEVCKLIFLPGMSTAEAVTNISGRGVGMDVVKTNIDAISGTIDLHSEFGRGTVFKIRVPLTLAIVPALVISSGGEQFAIPQVNLLELIRVGAAQKRNALEFIHGSPVFRLRDRLLPIVYLNHELELPATETENLSIVVLQANDARFGLVVDHINETREIVVKPLAQALDSVHVFTGATIMGDGRVALILDVPAFAEHARVVALQRKRPQHDYARDESARERNASAMLLVRTGSGSRLAIPLERVTRLEQFPADILERSGDCKVVQYRGQILSLLDVCKVLAEPDARLGDHEDGLRHVVVFGPDGEQVGLEVDEILDVVNDPLSIQSSVKRPGVLGTAVIQNRVTELFDVNAFLERIAPHAAR